MRVRIFRSALNNVVPASAKGFLTVRQYLDLSQPERDALHAKVTG